MSDSQDHPDTTGAGGPEAARPVIPAAAHSRSGPAEVEYLTAELLESPRRRRIWLPLVLFVVTCFSTFWSAIMDWQPAFFIGNADYLRRLLASHWEQGLIYMAAVIGILLFHEMGHFIATVIHRIPASFPFFIPLPISPIGTMGAVIGMAGHRANRREMFDIGIAGPLAGLVLAIPVLWIGIRHLDMSTPAYGPMAFDCPLLVRWMIHWLRPELGEVSRIAISQVNPWFMAAWVGLFVTGLNMMPISQLDGGHVIYALYVRRAHYLARAFLISVILYIVFTDAYMWSVMLIIVTVIGTDHPPTANDRMPLGRFRVVLGTASLILPFICFPPHGLFME
ncbi:MAG: site-2 protease family protein [Planctomycetales bacterium]|nr:site-2 protease family protein [Planctomycetales bacterium]